MDDVTALCHLDKESVSSSLLPSQQITHVSSSEMGASVTALLSLSPASIARRNSMSRFVSANMLLRRALSSSSPLVSLSRIEMSC